jgi:hypothetical protein
MVGAGVIALGQGYAIDTGCWRISPEDRFFVSRYGDRITRKSVYELVARYGKAARIEGVRCSRHTLRHTGAKRFILAGGDAFTLQKLLGHTSLCMVRGYIELAAVERPGSARVRRRPPTAASATLSTSATKGTFGGTHRIGQAEERHGMALPGGPADKLGNRYEREWAVSCLLDVLSGQAESIRFEVPGAEGQGFEFRVRMAGHNDWHQVKRASTLGQWSNAHLSSEGVLQAFARKLSIGDRCTFVSSVAAFQLRELSDRARESQDFDEFEREFLAAKSWSEAFDALCATWEETRDAAYDGLKRVSVRVVDEEELRARNGDRIALHVDGNTENASDVLRGLIDESLYKELRAEDIWTRLRDRGFRPRDLAADTDLRSRIQARAEAFVESVQALLIAGRSIPRAESGQVTDLLLQGNRVFVTGGAGSGKSTVLSQVARDAMGQGWPVMSLRLDRIGPAETAEALGGDLGLPASPVIALAGVAAGEDSLLILDQLDAVSLVAGARSNQFDLVAELVAQAARQPGMRMVLSCRQFDLDNDFRLMSLATAEGTQRVEVSLLDETTVAEVLGWLGVSPDHLADPMRELLRVPQHLALFAQLAHAQVVNVSLHSLKDLYDRFWIMQASRLRARLHNDSRWLETIDFLCDEIARRQELFIPLPRLDQRSEETQALASEGLIVVEGHRVGFFHETFFDYVFARRFVGAGHPIRDLLDPPQDLFRRRQVRQILAHERDADRARYLQDLRFLIHDEAVRSHLREVAIASLTLVGEPTAEEWAILAPLLEDPEDWRFSRAWQVVRSNPRFFDFADAQGLWKRWLESEDQRIVNGSLWALIPMVEVRGSRVAQLLRRYLNRSSEWNARLRWFVRVAKLGSSREMVDLVLALIQVGGFDG